MRVNYLSHRSSKGECAVEGDATDFVPLWLSGISEDPSLGFADKVSVGVHFKGAVQIWSEHRR